jgi:phosphoribosyl-ATP pyrophosphohydrolase
MIVPSIDLQGGQAVQLIGGKTLAIEAGDPMPIAERFSRVGEIAVIDLDAAMGTGSNAHLVEALCRRFPCRVGGGIRDEATARRWLDAGARKVILGTAAKPELLSKLPKDRVQAALDAVDGEVVVEGWKTKTGARIEQKMAELLPYVGGFLITFVEREGRLGGTAIDRMAPLIAAAGKTRITFAGGFTTGEDIADADRLGADAQVGMALYSGRLSLAEGFSAPLRTDRADGLLATVVVDPNGQALGLCWSSKETLAAALDEGRGVYWSRSRGGPWRKGDTSGAVQRLIRVDVDCDRDALRFVVEQADPGFCHLASWTCWGPAAGLSGLEQTLRARKESAPEGSYTRRLFTDPTLLAAKLREEADELARAESTDEVAHEAADLIYFTMARMAAAGVSLDDVGRILDQRALKITRRPGDAKT